MHWLPHTNMGTGKWASCANPNWFGLHPPLPSQQCCDASGGLHSYTYWGIRLHSTKHTDLHQWKCWHRSMWIRATGSGLWRRLVFGGHAAAKSIPFPESISSSFAMCFGITELCICYLSPVELAKAACNVTGTKWPSDSILDTFFSNIPHCT